MVEMVDSMILPSAHDEALEHALAHLVDQGVIDEALALRIEDERDRDAALALASAPVSVTRHTRLPEVLGYLGGAFVAAAALLLIANFWDPMTLATRIGLAFGGSAALIVAGLVIARAVPGGWARSRTSEETARRRLVGLLLVLAAPLAGLGVGLILDDRGIDPVLLPSAALALVVCVLATYLAAGVVPTLGLFAAASVTLGGLFELFDPVSTLVIIVAIAVGAGAWTALAPRLTGAPLVALSIGLFSLVVAGFNAAVYSGQSREIYDEFGNYVGLEPPEWGAAAVAPVGYAILLGVVAVGIAMYLRGGAWPWIGGAGLASAAVVSVVANQAYGQVAAFFGAGVVLLVLSAVLLVRRGRQTEHPRTESGRDRSD